MTQNLAYLLDIHFLLLYNYYGGPKQKSFLDILLVIEKKVYQIWRDKKVKFFITFNVEEAFSRIVIDI